MLGSSVVVLGGTLAGPSDVVLGGGSDGCPAGAGSGATGVLGAWVALLGAGVLLPGAALLAASALVLG